MQCNSLVMCVQCSHFGGAFCKWPFGIPPKSMHVEKALKARSKRASDELQTSSKRARSQTRTKMAKLHTTVIFQKATFRTPPRQLMINCQCAHIYKHSKNTCSLLSMTKYQGNTSCVMASSLQSDGHGRNTMGKQAACWIYTMCKLAACWKT